MGIWRFQVAHAVDGGVLEDRIFNTFHFDSDQSFGDDADDIVGRISVFYNLVDTYLHFSMAGSAEVKVYDLLDPEPRPPLLTTTITYTPSTNTALTAPEVAICASFKADPVAGINPGSLRGRIFLGRVSAAAYADNGAGVPILTSSVRSTIATALEDLCKGPDAGDGRLCVFSPTLAGPPPWDAATLDAATHDVTTVWVDNALDTIRGRGVATTARTTVPVT